MTTRHFIKTTALFMLSLSGVVGSVCAAEIPVADYNCGHKLPYLPVDLAPPEETDQIFVGCQREQLPDGTWALVLEIDRYLGDPSKWPGDRPARLRVVYEYIEGEIGPPEQQTTAENTVTRSVFIGKGGELNDLGPVLWGSRECCRWCSQMYDIPVEDVNVPKDPDGTDVPTKNYIAMIKDIDAPGACLWAAIEIPAPNPVIMVHGIKTDADDTWSGNWPNWLDGMGVPNKAIEVHAWGNIGPNAEIIAREYENLREQWTCLWNSDRVLHVNILSHSKGGLDSRHFAKHHKAGQEQQQVV